MKRLIWAALLSLATQLIFMVTVAHTSAAQSCGYYVNSEGDTVPRPCFTPYGATALCRDGTYSYSEHRSGSCSWHDGVAVWLTDNDNDQDVDNDSVSPQIDSQDQITTTDPEDDDSAMPQTDDDDDEPHAPRFTVIASRK